MSDDLIIDMKSEDKKVIVQALQNGLERFEEHITNIKSITNIGYTGTKWDIINYQRVNMMLWYIKGEFGN